MRIRNVLSCVIMGLAFGQISHAAEQTIALDLKGVEVKGHQEFDLKKLMSEQNANLDFASTPLISVDVAAIARTKDAMASLIAGGGKVASEAIPFANKLDKSQSMQHVVLTNQVGQQQQSKDTTFVLAIDGAAKVESVTVTLGSPIVGDSATMNIVPPYPDPRNPFPRRDDWRDRDRRGREVIVRCESHNYRMASCYVGGNARYAYVRRQHSIASCRQGSDWWLDQRRNVLMVRNGCRADFGVVVGGYGPRY